MTWPVGLSLLRYMKMHAIMLMPKGQAGCALLERRFDTASPSEYLYQQGARPWAVAEAAHSYSLALHFGPASIAVVSGTPLLGQQKEDADFCNLGRLSLTTFSLSEIPHYAVLSFLRQDHLSGAFLASCDCSLVVNPCHCLAAAPQLSSLYPLEAGASSCLHSPDCERPLQ